MDKIQALSRGNGIQIPLLLKKLFAMDTCWEMKKKIFFSEMTMVSTKLLGNLHTQE